MTRALLHLRPFTYFSRLARSALVRLLARHRRRLGAARIACFPGDDIGDHVIAHGWYEDLLLRAIFDQFLAADADAFRSGAALDVGANIGNHSLWLSRRFAQVYAFEPNPVCIKLFEANMLMNQVDNVRLFPLGLSDGSTQMLFHADLESNLGRSGVTQALAATATRSFPVHLDRGDHVLAGEIPAQLPVLLVKLDIEGHEIQALAGLQETLLRHQPLVLFETHRAGGAGGSDAIVDLLGQWGYAHFHVLEANASPYRNRLAKLVYRLTRGWNLTVRAVARPDDRSHALVIASVRPRCAC
jgi:FkbM family methyltransferase